MHKNQFLFEVGVEEIPSGYILNAQKFLEDYFQIVLNEKRVSYKEIIGYSTPRRLAVQIASISDFQADTVEEKTGPAVKIAYLDNGSLSKAGSGFLRGCNSEEKDIRIKKNDKGEYISVLKKIKGLPVKDILPGVCLSAIEKINFPKTMRWKSLNARFVRPIRWIAAILNEDVVSFDYFGIESDRLTYGNRFVAQDVKVRLVNPSDYVTKLKEFSVIPCREERKKLISQQLDKISGKNFIVERDEVLLEQVTDLVEYPTAVLAEFEPKYLSLPPEIIRATLKENQKYFIATDNQGKLINNFVFVSNGDPEYSDCIRMGNQKVIRARLEDAEFYFNQDIKKPFPEYVELLKKVTFHEKLGSLYDKTQRIIKLSCFIAECLDSARKTLDNSERIAYLCKADLVTLMLQEKEFTKLQGYVGMHYAKISGESDIVSKGVFEHYLPRGHGDKLPGQLEGAIVAIADKIDTVCGIILAGHLPSGSQDPFALRRSANGILLIIKKFKMKLDLNLLIAESVNQFKLIFAREDISDRSRILHDFFKQRISWILEQDNIENDVINSVIDIHEDNLSQLIAKAQAIQDFKKDKQFLSLVKGFKRATNIIGKADAEVLSNKFIPENLEIEAEKKLYLKLKESEKLVEDLAAAGNYPEILKSLVALSTYIDNFFDNVLVNTEDIALRNNRYALLVKIKKTFLKIADISKINYETN